MSEDGRKSHLYYNYWMKYQYGIKWKKQLPPDKQEVVVTKETLYFKRASLYGT